MTDPAQAPSGPAPDWAAIARLVAGEPAADAHAQTRDDAARAWLAAHPAEAARLEALDRVLRGDVVSPARLSTAAPAVDVESALARVRSFAGRDGAAPMEVGSSEESRFAPQLTVVRGAAPRSPSTSPVRPTSTVRARHLPARRRAGALLAASVALAAGLGVVNRWRAHGGAGVVAAGRVQQHTTGVGERRVLHLADGSQVVLGPASTLDVPADFAAGAGARRVHLTGEAYFRAVHDARRPFEVAAGDAVVRDIGTAFVVRAPAPPSADAAARQAVDVAVTDGAVRLQPASATSTDTGSGILLRAGDRGRVVAAGAGAATAAVIARGTDVAADTAWTTGRLVFRDAPLTEVAGALRRWYGIDLRFADSAVAARHLTATFAGESTAAVLRVVGLATGARLERRGDTVVVREAPPSR